MTDVSEIESLQEQWKILYQQYLPYLASTRDSVQPCWPVTLDHCFARIVLDNAVGIDKPWHQVVKAPAIKHISLGQLKEVLNLGENIASGKANLVELDEKSLALRGKKGKRQQNKRKAGGCARDGEEASSPSKKSKKSEEAISSYFRPSPRITCTSVGVQPATTLLTPDKTPSSNADSEAPKIETEEEEEEDTSTHLRRIQSAPNLTPFRKLTLSLLCQVPRGQFSTYGAMAGFISIASHKSCARAVGNAMRNNPFAPGVPCHRILAGDGSLGGFKGGWGEDGRYAGEKRKLLALEGVKFDSSGKVKGRPFTQFRMPESLQKNG